MQTIAPRLRTALLFVMFGALNSFLAWGPLSGTAQSAVHPIPSVVMPEAIIRSLAPLPDYTPRPEITAAAQPKPAEPVFNQNTDVRARILMYHYVRSGMNPRKDRTGYRLSVRPEELDAHIATLKQLGYKAISMADLAAGKGDDRSVVLTFDDGYADFYSNAYPILKKHGWSATLYVITNKIGGPYLSWDQIRELQQNGIEIGSHTVEHYELNKMAIPDQRREITESKRVLEEQLGVPVTSICYPVGRYNDDTVRLVKEAGYLNAATTEPGLVRVQDNPFTYKRVRMNPDMSLRDLDHLFR